MTFFGGILRLMDNSPASSLLLVTCSVFAHLTKTNAQMTITILWSVWCLIELLKQVRVFY